MLTITYIKKILYNIAMKNICLKKTSLTFSALSAVLALIFGFAITNSNAASNNQIYAYDSFGDTQNFAGYAPSGAKTSGFPELNAQFTTSAINVDGNADAAYANATASNIGTNGSNIKALWDGPVLYLLANVKSSDPLYIGFDYYNDRTAGQDSENVSVFNINSSGTLGYSKNTSIPSLSTQIADNSSIDFTNRIKSYKTVKSGNEYTVELALQIEDRNAGTDGEIPLQNGRKFSMDFKIGSQYWSHQTYTNEPSNWGDDHARSFDWGYVILGGHNNSDNSDFASSLWPISDSIWWINSKNYDASSYTAETKAALDDAKSQGQTVLNKTNATSQEIKTAGLQLRQAIKNLRWVDTKYPDPADLPVIKTLPNPYIFFAGSKKGQAVQTKSDWEARKAEILDMAQFYEYGYKPAKPSNIVIKSVSTSGAISADITANNVTKTVSVTVSNANNSKNRSSGAPIFMSFDGTNSQFSSAGWATIDVSSFASTDSRTDDDAYGTRQGASGGFGGWGGTTSSVNCYSFYPNVRGAQNVSSEMCSAWGASTVVDILEAVKSSNVANASNLSSKIDLNNIAIQGFSINGKRAFVTAVFDSRFKFCMPGAAGASGPSPWRYVYFGHKYDWTSQSNYKGASTGVVQATGTELLANQVRHNRVRTNELFRHFLDNNHSLKKIDGAYGYATRLPYDQNDLIATLSSSDPLKSRYMMIFNTPNDYNDGSESDNLGIAIAKSVYKAVGNSSDETNKLLTYNIREWSNASDPHGNEASQYTRAANYFNYVLYNDSISASDLSRLQQNPFELPISNNKQSSPFDYYYGGYNTITGGTDGISGQNGWYYHSALTNN